MYSLLLLTLCVLQPSYHDHMLLRKSSKKTLLLESSSRLPSDRLLPPPGRWEACPPPAISALSPALTASQRTLPLLAACLRSSQAPLLAWPSPHSCLLNSSQWLQALGQRLHTSKVSRAPAHSLRVPFTHCTLPHPEAEGHVSFHQQTCQELSRCQALTGTSSCSSPDKPSEPHSTALREGPSHPRLPRPTTPLATSTPAIQACHCFPNTLSLVLSQGLRTCRSFCLECPVNSLPGHPLPLSPRSSSCSEISLLTHQPAPPAEGQPQGHKTCLGLTGGWLST